MDRLSVQQRWVVAVLALVIAVIALGYFIYWVAIVENHPWFKHSLLFAVVSIVGFVFAAYAWPRSRRAE